MGLEMWAGKDTCVNSGSTASVRDSKLVQLVRQITRTSLNRKESYNTLPLWIETDGQVNEEETKLL